MHKSVDSFQNKNAIKTHLYCSDILKKLSKSHTVLLKAI